MNLLALTGVVVVGILLMTVSAFFVLHKRAASNPVQEPVYEPSCASYSLTKKGN